MADILWAAAVVAAILIATVGLGFILVLLLGLGERVSARLLHIHGTRITPGWAEDDLPLAENSPHLRNGVTRL